MIVLVSSPQPNHSPNPKLTSNIITLHTPPNIINNNNPTTLSYEPTTVLDLCRCPSPEKKHHHSSTVPKQDPEEHVLHNLDWWDSIMKDLGLHDDSVTPLLKANKNNSNNNPCIPDFPPSQDPTFDHQQDFNTFSDIYTNQNLSTE